MWMIKAALTEYGVEILLPKPGAVKQDTIYLIMLSAIFQFFMAGESVGRFVATACTQ